MSVLVVLASPLVSAFGSLPALNPGGLVANTTAGLCSTAEHLVKRRTPLLCPPLPPVCVRAVFAYSPLWTVVPWAWCPLASLTEPRGPEALDTFGLPSYTHPNPSTEPAPHLPNAFLTARSFRTSL